jgi:hypothetical protein
MTKIERSGSRIRIRIRIHESADPDPPQNGMDPQHCLPDCCPILLEDVSSMIGLQAALRFNGGGHINHSIFWQVWCFYVSRFFLIFKYFCGGAFCPFFVFRRFFVEVSTVVQNLLILRMLFRTFALAEAASPLAPWPPLFRRILDPLKR